MGKSSVDLKRLLQLLQENEGWVREEKLLDEVVEYVTRRTEALLCQDDGALREMFSEMSGRIKAEALLVIAEGVDSGLIAARMASSGRRLQRLVQGSYDAFRMAGGSIELRNAYAPDANEEAPTEWPCPDGEDPIIHIDILRKMIEKGISPSSPFSISKLDNVHDPKTLRRWFGKMKRASYTDDNNRNDNQKRYWILKPLPRIPE